jgi:hypothetical protein
MIDAILTRLRLLRAWLAWVRSVRQTRPAGLEALFAAPDPAEVGRQEQFGAAILDTATWLETHGWEGDDAGERQVYAFYLLERRAAYERGEVRSS